MRTRLWLVVLALLLATLACNTPAIDPTEEITIQPADPDPTEAPPAEGDDPAADTDTGDDSGDTGDSGGDSGGDSTGTSDSGGGDDPAPSGYTTLSALETDLLAALAGPRDYEVLTGFMANQFEVSVYGGGGVVVEPDEAALTMQSDILPAEAIFSYTLNNDFMGDEFAELLGTDPVEFFGGQVVGLTFTEGWGEEGADEALLLYGQRENGTYYWKGILIAPGGFPSPLEIFRNQIVTAWLNEDTDFLITTMADPFKVGSTQALLFEDTPELSLKWLTDEVIFPIAVIGNPQENDPAAIEAGTGYDPYIAFPEASEFIWIGQSDSEKYNILLVVDQQENGDFYQPGVLLIPTS